MPTGEGVSVFLMVSSMSLMMAQPLGVAKVVFSCVASALLAFDVTTWPSFLWHSRARVSLLLSGVLDRSGATYPTWPMMRCSFFAAQ